jgi:hypothetical protein
MVGELFYNPPQAERNRTNFTKIIFMSRSSKLFIGILSFLPIVLVFVMFFMVLRLIPNFIEWSDHNDPGPQEVFSVFGPLFIIGFGMAILSIGLLIFFIMHLLRHKALDSTERVIWILVFLFAGIIGYPIYWYMRIWKDEI